MWRYDKSYMMSNDDISNVVSRHIPVVSSADLHKFRDIDDVMRGHDDILILYQDKDGVRGGRPWKSGHWTVLKKLDDENIVHFDPYGTFPDDQLKYIPENYKRRTYQMSRNLARLLADSDYKNIHYNDKQFQKLQTGNNTCGRHVAFYIMSNMDPDEYVNYMKDLCKTFNTTPDDIVVQATGPYLS